MLKKIGNGFRQFGTVVGKSCYDMEFYRQVRSQPWTRGLAYFFKLMLLVTLVTAAFLGPAIFGGLSALGKYVDSNVPEGASLTLADGQLSAALPQPFELSGDPGDGKLIIDTSVTGMDFPRERLDDKGGVLIGREAMFVKQSDYEERAYSLKDFPNFSVNKRQLMTWMSQYVFPVSAGLTVGLALAYFLGITIGNLFFVLIGAALSLLLAKLWRVSLAYKEWMSVSFYAITLPVALGALFDGLGWTRIPVFPIVFFMIIAAVVADERARRQAIMPPAAPLPTGPSGSGQEPPPSADSDKTSGTPDGPSVGGEGSK